MTVAELIAELRKLPPGLPVVAYARDAEVLRDVATAEGCTIARFVGFRGESRYASAAMLEEHAINYETLPAVVVLPAP